MAIMPDTDKAAYLEALAKDPELVLRESDPTRFLECEHNDPWKAAKRLACYWKYRKEIFGAERAFLPLHQTGGPMAALNEQDLELLNTGYLVILPNDKRGRSVMASDRTRFLPEHSFPHYHQSKMRLIFYILTQMAENRTSQQQGIVFLSLIAMAPDSELGKKVFPLIHQAMPIATMETHIIFLPSRAVYRTFLKKIVEHTIGLLTNYFAPFATCHHGKTDEEVIRKLKSQGFSKSGIPEWMGGSWKLEDFDKWKRQRVRFELALLKTAEEELKRKRKVNALLSRQKRARQKSQFVQLQEQCASLRASNQQLAAENQQLQEHLAYAESEAAILEYLEQRTAADFSSNNETKSTTVTISAADLLTDDVCLCDVFN
jgi:cell division protein FtsB